MLSREKVESFLIDAGLDFEEIDEGIWLVRPQRSESGEAPPVVVSHAPPVLVLRSGIRRAPEDGGRVAHHHRRRGRRLLGLGRADEPDALADLLEVQLGADQKALDVLATHHQTAASDFG